jgi:hypothetical protein
MRTALSRPTPWGLAALIGLLGSLVVAIVVVAFVWPAATSTAKNLPVGISGPSALIEQVEGMLAAQDPAPFVLSEFSSRDEAVTAIETRAVYGALVLADPTSGDAPEVLVATAASPAVAQALRGVAVELQSQIDTSFRSALTERLAAIMMALQAGQMPPLQPDAALPDGSPQVTVTDVVPLAEGDSTGAGLAASAFPLVLGGLIGGIVLSLRVLGPLRRLVGLLAYGAAAGALIVLVMQTWFGILQGSWLLNVVVVGAAVSATAAFVIGLHAVMGPAGIAVAAIVTVLFATPIAGAAVPPEFLPEPWGVIGQWFVPGASATLLRSASFFPDAATAVQWLTLGAWLITGVVLALLGHRRASADASHADDRGSDDLTAAAPPASPTPVEV